MSTLHLDSPRSRGLAGLRASDNFAEFQDYWSECSSDAGVSEGMKGSLKCSPCCQTRPKTVLYIASAGPAVDLSGAEAQQLQEAPEQKSVTNVAADPQLLACTSFGGGTPPTLSTREVLEESNTETSSKPRRASTSAKAKKAGAHVKSGSAKSKDSAKALRGGPATPKNAKASHGAQQGSSRQGKAPGSGVRASSSGTRGKKQAARDTRGKANSANTPAPTAGDEHQLSEGFQASGKQGASVKHAPGEVSVALPEVGAQAVPAVADTSAACSGVSLSRTELADVRADSGLQIDSWDSVSQREFHAAEQRSALLRGASLALQSRPISQLSSSASATAAARSPVNATRLVGPSVDGGFVSDSVPRAWIDVKGQVRANHEILELEKREDDDMVFNKLPQQILPSPPNPAFCLNTERPPQKPAIDIKFRLLSRGEKRPSRIAKLPGGVPVEYEARPVSKTEGEIPGVQVVPPRTGSVRFAVFQVKRRGETAPAVVAYSWRNKKAVQPPAQEGTNVACDLPSCPEGSDQSPEGTGSSPKVGQEQSSVCGAAASALETVCASADSAQQEAAADQLQALPSVAAAETQVPAGYALLQGVWCCTGAAQMPEGDAGQGETQPEAAPGTLGYVYPQCTADGYAAQNEAAWNMPAQQWDPTYASAYGWYQGSNDQWGAYQNEAGPVTEQPQTAPQKGGSPAASSVKGTSMSAVKSDPADTPAKRKAVTPSWRTTPKALSGRKGSTVGRLASGGKQQAKISGRQSAAAGKRGSRSRVSSTSTGNGKAAAAAKASDNASSTPVNVQPYPAEPDAASLHPPLQTGYSAVYMVPTSENPAAPEAQVLVAVPAAPDAGAPGDMPSFAAPVLADDQPSVASQLCACSPLSCKKPGDFSCSLSTVATSDGFTSESKWFFRPSWKVPFSCVDQRETPKSVDEQAFLADLPTHSDVEQVSEPALADASLDASLTDGAASPEMAEASDKEEFSLKTWLANKLSWTTPSGSSEACRECCAPDSEAVNELPKDVQPFDAREDGASPPQMQEELTEVFPPHYVSKSEQTKDGVVPVLFRVLKRRDRRGSAKRGHILLPGGYLRDKVLGLDEGREMVLRDAAGRCVVVAEGARGEIILRGEDGRDIVVSGTYLREMILRGKGSSEVSLREMVQSEDAVESAAKLLSAATFYEGKEEPVFRFRVIQSQRPKDKEKRRLLAFRPPVHVRNLPPSVPESASLGLVDGDARVSGPSPPLSCACPPTLCRSVSAGTEDSVVTMKYEQRSTYVPLPTRGKTVHFVTHYGLESLSARDGSKIVAAPLPGVSSFAAQVARDAAARVAQRQATKKEEVEDLGSESSEDDAEPTEEGGSETSEEGVDEEYYEGGSDEQEETLFDFRKATAWCRSICGEAELFSGPNSYRSDGRVLPSCEREPCTEEVGETQPSDFAYEHTMERTGESEVFARAEGSGILSDRASHTSCVCSRWPCSCLRVSSNRESSSNMSDAIASQSSRPGGEAGTPVSAAAGTPMSAIASERTSQSFCACGRWPCGCSPVASKAAVSSRESGVASGRSSHSGRLSGPVTPLAAEAGTLNSGQASGSTQHAFYECGCWPCGCSPVASKAAVSSRESGVASGRSSPSGRLSEAGTPLAADAGTLNSGQASGSTQPAFCACGCWPCGCSPVASKAAVSSRESGVASGRSSPSGRLSEAGTPLAADAGTLNSGQASGSTQHAFCACGCWPCGCSPVASKAAVSSRESGVASGRSSHSGRLSEAGTPLAADAGTLNSGQASGSTQHAFCACGCWPCGCSPVASKAAVSSRESGVASGRSSPSGRLSEAGTPLAADAGTLNSGQASGSTQHAFCACGCWPCGCSPVASKAAVSSRESEVASGRSSPSGRLSGPGTPLAADAGTLNSGQASGSTQHAFYECGCWPRGSGRPSSEGHMSFRGSDVAMNVSALSGDQLGTPTAADAGTPGSGRVSESASHAFCACGRRPCPCASASPHEDVSSGATRVTSGQRILYVHPSGACRSFVSGGSVGGVAIEGASESAYRGVYVPYVCAPKPFSDSLTAQGRTLVLLQPYPQPPPAHVVMHVADEGNLPRTQMSSKHISTSCCTCLCWPCTCSPASSKKSALTQTGKTTSSHAFLSRNAVATRAVVVDEGVPSDIVRERSSRSLCVCGCWPCTCSPSSRKHLSSRSSTPVSRETSLQHVPFVSNTVVVDGKGTPVATIAEDEKGTPEFPGSPAAGDNDSRDGDRSACTALWSCVPHPPPVFAGNVNESPSPAPAPGQFVGVPVGGMDQTSYVATGSEACYSSASHLVTYQLPEALPEPPPLRTMKIRLPVPPSPELTAGVGTHLTLGSAEETAILPPLVVPVAAPLSRVKIAVLPARNSGPDQE
ncbi:hypothetical protein BESB_060860 [Besnoitia besnoiti]|uniref:Uncharacterized protein n=1 Tax=Besnoitia besnoiti TaxID=94643 RepID=A0A2A9MBE4_BESBE|nr:hypothetical protein BESB_060860 [Besnoitia besnoiti]PFH35199.1 hypothetical protein BESB_060860 [Besnoitia besnoiti]